MTYEFVSLYFKFMGRRHVNEMAIDMNLIRLINLGILSQPSTLAILIAVREVLKWKASLFRFDILYKVVIINLL